MTPIRYSVKYMGLIPYSVNPHPGPILIFKFHEIRVGSAPQAKKSELSTSFKLALN